MCCCCSSASHPACMQLVASGYANLGPVNASIQLPSYQLLFSESEQIIAQQLECVVRAFCISCSVGAVHSSHISYLACPLSSNKHRVRACCISCSWSSALQSYLVSLLGLSSPGADLGFEKGGPPKSDHAHFQNHAHLKGHMHTP